MAATRDWFTFADKKPDGTIWLPDSEVLFEDERRFLLGAKWTGDPEFSLWTRLDERPFCCKLDQSHTRFLNNEWYHVSYLSYTDAICIVPEASDIITDYAHDPSKHSILYAFYQDGSSHRQLVAKDVEALMDIGEKPLAIARMNIVGQVSVLVYGAPDEVQARKSAIESAKSQADIWKEVERALEVKNSEDDLFGN